MPNRGVIYLVWGGETHERLLNRSMTWLKKSHPDIKIAVHRLDEPADLLDKSRMYDLSPFETTLFLDTDTVVLGNIDFIFDRAEKHGIACCICEEPWARRYPSIRGDVVEYNTGVLAFSKLHPWCYEVFDEWKRIGRDIDSSITFYNGPGDLARMPCNDQAGFAAAVHSLQFNPFVLPLNWNFRPQWHRSLYGPIKIWHDYREVPDSLHKWNQEQTSAGSIIKYAQFG